MHYRTEIIPYTLRFIRPAKTSRGEYMHHKIWYVIIRSAEDESVWGIGECAPLYDLSCDYNEHYFETLQQFCNGLENNGYLDTEALRPYPSMLFGLETALQLLNAKSFKLFDTPFARGESGIQINGLIWMGDYNYMMQQIETKIEQGFRCIKLKIGAIGFEKEIDLLTHIRKQYPADKIELRVDANGAFSPKDALKKLELLAKLDIHSIEQPIRAGQWKEMSGLTRSTPIPIALDEELIGIHSYEKKKELFAEIAPQYIILKPTLHGGLSGTREWIGLAEKLGVKWWITSALESNIGLNCIAQFCSTFDNPLPQGLGTGSLYENNIEMPLEIKKDELWFEAEGKYFNVKDIKKDA